MFDLRDYQKDAMKKIAASLKKVDRVILSLPTGAGKTVIAAMVVKHLKEGKKVVFVADRQTLVYQTAARFDEYDIDSHIVMQTEVDHDHPVQIACAQTLEKRVKPDVDLVIVDECHTRRKSIESWIEDCGVKAIGLTATPFTVGLMDFWEEVITCTTTQQLIDDGWLILPRVFAGKEADLSGARVKRSGEWDDYSVADCMADLRGDIVREWIKRCEDIFGYTQPTLVFTPTIEYGARLVERFEHAGFDFRQIAAGDNKNRRIKNLDDFNNGRCDGLVSVDALAKGFDVPHATVLVVARPVRKSKMVHIQMLGRIMRPAEGKEQCIVIDHAGNFQRHSRKTIQFWNNGYDESMAEDSNDGDGSGPPVTKKCPDCQEFIAAACKVCPNCGYRFQDKEYTNTDEELQEIPVVLHNPTSIKEKYSEYHNSSYRKKQLYAYCQGWAVQVGSPNPDGAALAAYRTITDNKFPTTYNNRHKREWNPQDCPDDLAHVLDIEREAYLKKAFS